MHATCAAARTGAAAPPRLRLARTARQRAGRSTAPRSRHTTRAVSSISSSTGWSPTQLLPEVTASLLDYWHQLEPSTQDAVLAMAWLAAGAAAWQLAAALSAAGVQIYDAHMERAIQNSKVSWAPLSCV